MSQIIMAFHPQRDSLFFIVFFFIYLHYSVVFCLVPVVFVYVFILVVIFVHFYNSISIYLHRSDLRKGRCFLSSLMQYFSSSSSWLYFSVLRSVLLSQSLLWYVVICYLNMDLQFIVDFGLLGSLLQGLTSVFSAVVSFLNLHSGTVSPSWSSFFNFGKRCLLSSLWSSFLHLRQELYSIFSAMVSFFIFIMALSSGFFTVVILLHLHYGIVFCVLSHVFIFHLHYGAIFCLLRSGVHSSSLVWCSFLSALQWSSFFNFFRRCHLSSTQWLFFFIFIMLQSSLFSEQVFFRQYRVVLSSPQWSFLFFSNMMSFPQWSSFFIFIIK